ncbi:g-protein alpha subunit [Teladorsagia circumcincta]|uniref:G-protein alpha subunit n=1 Tax=Teladorsagia circumcincta TaxID=45464 RepID=A0A2G9UZ51_TELCI|nr:g-protein alpha subunit [Teladorsagia circumcincta]
MKHVKSKKNFGVYDCPGMGNCDSASAELGKRSRKINAIIEHDKKANETVVKLLLLGAGESGKSTILKQMNTAAGLFRIIHDNGFSPDEAEQKISVVCANTVQSIGALIDGMKILNIPFASKQSLWSGGRVYDTRALTVL